MNKEKFLAKGVARKYEKGEVLFNVESLHEHYEGINYHLTDILEGGFIRPNDVLDGDIREIEVVVVDETPYDESEEGTVGISTIKTIEEVDAEIKEANAEIPEELPVWVNPPLDEIEVVAEVVAPEIVAPEVIVDETPEE